MSARLSLASAVLALFTCAACGDDAGSGVRADAGDTGDADGGPDLVFGCPSLTEPLASAGDPTDGDDWESFAAPFFESYCTRCHASDRSGTERNGAPPGFDWDDEAVVDSHLSRIRNAVGVANFMPPSSPKPSCDERARLVRWIDAGAP